MSLIGFLDLKLGVNISGLTKGLKNARKKLSGFSNSLGGVASSLFSIKTAIAGAGAGLVIKSIVGSTADMEQTKVALETIIGDVDKAATLIKEIKQFGAETPFEFPELADSAKKLIAFGFGADTVVEEMRRLGDVASGLGIPLNELADLYGKARVSGRLMAEDINQLTGRGIPIIGELAKQFGVAESEVKELVSKGKVGFPQLQEAFKSLTGEGGKFNGMMAKQSQTLNGLISTLKDTVGELGLEIGEAILPQLKDMVKALKDMKPAATEAAKGIATLASITLSKASGKSNLQNEAFNKSLQDNLRVWFGDKAVKQWFPVDEKVLSEGMTATATDAERAANMQRALNASPRLRAEILADNVADDDLKSSINEIDAKVVAENRKKIAEGIDAGKTKMQEALKNLQGQGSKLLDIFGKTGKTLASSVVDGVKEANRQAESKLFSDAKDRIAELREANKTDAERLKEGLAEIETLKPFGLTEQDAERQRKALQEQFGNVETPEVRFAGAAEFGGVAANSAILRNRFGNNSPLEKIQKNNEEQLKEQQQQTTWLSQLVASAQDFVTVKF